MASADFERIGSLSVNTGFRAFIEDELLPAIDFDAGGIHHHVVRVRHSWRMSVNPLIDQPLRRSNSCMNPTSASTASIPVAL